MVNRFCASARSSSPPALFCFLSLICHIFSVPADSYKKSYPKEKVRILRHFSYNNLDASIASLLLVHSSFSRVTNAAKELSLNLSAA